MTRTVAALAVLLATASPVLAQQLPTGQDSKLPTIVLVGDSIRLSYAPIVANHFKGKAVVVSEKANGGDSANVLKNLERWVIRKRPTIVHFNCGIHDTKKFRSTGKFQVAPEKYEANLKRVVERIRNETDAIVIFATTTPIMDERAANARQGRDYELLDASVKQYNAIAKELMTELKVPVNDLHSVLSAPQKPLAMENLLGADGVHLTAAARSLLGKRVAQFIGKHLPKKP